MISYLSFSLIGESFGYSSTKKVEQQKSWNDWLYLLIINITIEINKVSGKGTPTNPMVAIDKTNSKKKQ